MYCHHFLLSFFSSSSFLSISDWDSPSVILKEALALGGDADERGTMHGISSSSSSIGNGWGQQIFAGIDSPGGMITSGSTGDMGGLISASSSGRLTGRKSAAGGIASLTGSVPSSSTFFGDSPSILKKKSGGSVNSMSLGMSSQHTISYLFTTHHLIHISSLRSLIKHALIKHTLLTYPPIIHPLIANVLV